MVEIMTSHWIDIPTSEFWRIEPSLEPGYSEPDIQKATSHLPRFDVDQSIRDRSDALKTLVALDECNG